MESNKRSKESLYDDDELYSTVPKQLKTDPSGFAIGCGHKSSTERQSKEDAAQRPKKELADVLSAFGARRGERQEMQDAHLVVNKFDLGKPFLTRCSLFAVFDGHGGSRAAEYCERNLGGVLKEKLAAYDDLESIGKGLKKAYTECFKTVDESFLKIARQSKPVWKDGTTVTVMLLLDKMLYVANLGDSKAVVARRREDGTLTPMCLTVDHNPTDFNERMRIQKTGATVKDGRVNGVIEVSRSIGDGQFKTLGVISLPDVKKLTLNEHDLFAIIACDGLWKSFQNAEAVSYAEQQLNDVKKEELVLDPGESREQAEWRTVAERLAAEAVRRKCGDNVSVILVKLGDVAAATSSLP